MKPQHGGAGGIGGWRLGASALALSVAAGDVNRVKK